MIAHCEAAGVVLQEAFMYRFHPQWLRTKQLVDEGRIGELRAVQAWFSYFNDDAANIRNIAEYGGGALMDIGCYPISVARWLFGAEPDDVQAITDRDPTSGVDILTSAMMRFGTAQATFTVSTRTEPYQRVHIVGTTGRIEVEIPFNAPNDRPTRIFVTAGGSPPPTPPPRSRSSRPPTSTRCRPMRSPWRYVRAGPPRCRRPTHWRTWP